MAATFQKLCKHHGLTAYYVTTRRCVICSKAHSKKVTDRVRDKLRALKIEREIVRQRESSEDMEPLKWEATWQRIAAAFERRRNAQNHG